VGEGVWVRKAAAGSWIGPSRSIRNTQTSKDRRTKPKHQTEAKKPMKKLIVATAVGCMAWATLAQGQFVFGNKNLLVSPTD
jgi:hypothetical protein